MILLSERHSIALYLGAIIALGAGIVQAQSDIQDSDDITKFFNDLNSGNADEVDRAFAACPPPTCAPFTVLDDITGNLIRVQDFLAFNFYCSSFLPVTRNVVDLPGLQPLTDRTDRLTFAVQPFYNMTSKVALSGRSLSQSTSISDYFGFRNADLIDALDTNVKQKFNIDAPRIVRLFQDATVQERKFGGMLSMAYRNDHHAFMGLLPLYYIERNFFLNNDQINAISNDEALKLFGGGGGDRGTRDLIQELIVRDQVGIGDTRVKIGSYFADRLDRSCVIGAELTFPTALAFKKGLFGSNPDNTQAPFPFSFYNLYCDGTSDNEACKAAALTTLSTTGKNILIRMASTVNGVPLGQGAFGVGPYVEFQQYFLPRGRFDMNGSIEFLLPYSTNRFLLITRDLNEIKNRDYTADTSTPASLANLAYLDAAFEQMFYPRWACLNMGPGVICKANVALCAEDRNLQGQIGYDFWFKTGDHIRGFHDGKTTVPFRMSAAAAPHAWQNKFFGRITAQKHGFDYDLRFGIRGDVTFLSKGIGHDWTLGVDVVFDY